MSPPLPAEPVVVVPSGKYASSAAVDVVLPDADSPYSEPSATAEIPDTSDQMPIEPEVPSPADPPLIAKTPSRLPSIPRRIPPPKRDARTGEPPEAHSPNTAAEQETRDPHLAAEPLTEEPSEPAGIDWQVPETLLVRFEGLRLEPATRAWAVEADRLVRELGPAISAESDRRHAIIGQLDQMAAGAGPMADGLSDWPLATRLRRAGHALKRRLAVWRHVAGAEDSAAIPPEVASGPFQRLPLRLAQLDAVTNDSFEGKAWRHYLQIDMLHDWLAKRETAEDQVPRQLAEQIIKRLTQVSMSRRQQQLLATEPFAGLRDELRRWAAEPVDSAGLITHLEQYEQSGLPSHARLVANDRLHYDVSTDSSDRLLAFRLDSHYRNANLRIAITENLLNRLMPEREPEYARVRDTIGGIPVRGNSLTETKVGIRLTPDPRRVRLALEIEGQVASLTQSTSGVATFYNDSDSFYTARKPMVVDLSGIHLGPAEVSVYNKTRLRDLETDFDPIPLIGWLVSDVARSQHAQKRSEVVREIKAKVAAKARRRIDSETNERLGKISQRLAQNIIGPAQYLSLNPTMIGATTTQERLTMRLRLAGEDQLGSHTPRPRAPADSLASIQIHQSAINNVLDRLQLAGRTFTLPELMQHVATRLNRPAAPVIAPENEGISITFAQRNSVGVRLQDGRMELRLAVAALRRERQIWRDFEVRAYYCPKIEGQRLELVRDGTVKFAGERRASIALRGIFGKVFSRNRPLDLTPERLTTDPKLADLSITQFLIDDGWIGIALGPHRVAATTPTVAR